MPKSEEEQAREKVITTYAKTYIESQERQPFNYRFLGVQGTSIIDIWRK